MSIKSSLRKYTELGIGFSAISILLLAGCGGGSSGSTTYSGNASGAVAANLLLTETAASWNANLVSGISNWAATSSVVARANISTFVATGTGTYTYQSSMLDLATSSSVWSAGTYAAPYYLAASGWQRYDINSAASYTNNGDGTITATLTPWGRSEATAITRTDLTGQPVVCTNPMGSNFVGEDIGTASNPLIVTTASCAVAVTYPTGSASYTTTANSTTNDVFFLFDNSTSPTLTDGAGTVLSALPSIGTRLCLNGVVYDPIASPVAGADNYTGHFNYPYGTCSAADITTALATGYTSTAFISLKNTGNTVVQQVFAIKIGSYEGIYAFHLGKLMYGSYTPASTSTSTSITVNKTAANAQLQANGLPQLP